MAPCRFWQQGNCKFGNNCRNEHGNSSYQGHSQSGNRFGVLAGGSSSSSMSSRNTENPYSLTEDVIRKDLIEDRPPWILSAYGPGKDTPEQLFGGYPREQSFEEIRWFYEQEAAKGNAQGALNEINGIYQNAEQQIQTTLNNLRGAVQFVVDAANKHPNRLDVCKQSIQRPGGFPGVDDASRNNANANASASAFSSQGNNAFGPPPQGTSPFGAAPAPQPAGPSAFGQPSALGQRPNPFGAAPAFGQPAQMGNKPAFGQPAFGQPSQPTSTFGTPSTMGAKPNPFGAPAFGQPSQVGGNAFGQPSQMGGSAFGQPSQMGGSAFGQTSALGQKPNPFGSLSNITQGATANGSPFGNAASQSPFGQASANTNQSPFGALSGATAGATPSNPFGSVAASNASSQPAATNSPSPFGQPQPSNGLGAFGQPQQATGPSPFGLAPANAAPFGLSQPGQNVSNPLGQHQVVSSHNAQGAATNSTEPSYGVKGPDGRLQTFKGKPVVYRALKEGAPEVPTLSAFDGSVIKIWFPDGPTPYSPDTEFPDRSAYEQESVKAQWRPFMETAKFAGAMPLVPPMREWCKWDF